MKVSTVREDVLEAFQALERKTGRLDFRPQEIVEEVLRRSPERKAASVRTHVTSVMCADAPVHHDNHTDELSRVAPGIYRRNRNVGQVDSAPPTVERAAAVVSNTNGLGPGRASWSMCMPQPSKSRVGR